MSIPVDVADLAGLARTLERFGPAYLLTASAEGRVKAVSARPVLADGLLRVAAPGRGSLANAAAHPDVTLLWPPVVGGHSLLVDGTAEADGDDVVVRPTSGVLHRPAG